MRACVRTLPGCTVLGKVMLGTSLSACLFSTEGSGAEDKDERAIGNWGGRRLTITIHYVLIFTDSYGSSAFSLGVSSLVCTSYGLQVSPVF